MGTGVTAVLSFSLLLQHLFITLIFLHHSCEGVTKVIQATLISQHHSTPTWPVSRSARLRSNSWNYSAASTLTSVKPSASSRASFSPSTVSSRASFSPSSTVSRASVSSECFWKQYERKPRKTKVLSIIKMMTLQRNKPSAAKKYHDSTLPLLS